MIDETAGGFVAAIWRREAGSAVMSTERTEVLNVLLATVLVENVIDERTGSLQLAVSQHPPPEGQPGPWLRGLVEQGP